ncbi:unnamed protein product [Sphagnum troendelagicum]|uniref:alpha-amylase n=1 Tax=Sphagnum troendelagicum TaxID=128251 RepID=A0ABP0TDA2_9BRYO
MLSSPHANVSGVSWKPPAPSSLLLLLQQPVPSRHCAYPPSLVHNSSSLCPHLRTLFAAERILQIEKHHREQFKRKHASPFVIAASKEGEDADVLEGAGSQEVVKFSQRSHISNDAEISGCLDQETSPKESSADSNLKVSKRLRPPAADDTAASAVMEVQVAIDIALTAAGTAREQAQIAEVILVEHPGLLQKLSKGEKKLLSLKESLLSAVYHLEVANTAIENLHREIEAAKDLTKADELHIPAAEASVHKVQFATYELENSSRDAPEVRMNAAAVRGVSARVASNAQLEALQAANSDHKSDEERAKVIGGGRLGLLLEKESRRQDLLANGLRRETPEWMKRRLMLGQQGLPPRTSLLNSADVEAMLPLELPSPKDVWSIASAKVKDDMYTAQAAEKQALDLQRKVLQQTLERKTAKKWVKDPEAAEGKLASGTGTGREIVFQGFNWESWRRDWWLELAPKAADLSQCGITTVWLPPPTHSVAPQGYMPGDLYNMNSAYGTEDELKQCITEMHNHNILVLGDVVLNHRCAQKQDANGVWNVFGGKLDWGPEAIVKDDPNFQGHGNPSSGDFFHAAPNIDHSQAFVRKDIKEWMKWLRNDFQFDGWRLDFVRGFWGGYIKEYIEATKPAFAIGEYWDSLAYEGGKVCYNQDSHRQRIIDWINAAGGTSSAFDVTTKGILHSALHGEFWRLIDPTGKPPGVMGWWPSRAVTFLENHDTGSTQGHWPFPRDKIMMGYAYILTHPGTPVIFYDHFYDFGLHTQIAELIAVRTRTGVHCRSPVKIFQANFEGYVAKIGEGLVMKIGDLDWNPSKQNNLKGSWKRSVDRDGYKVWERK